jgi:predicted transcriptional regulator
MTARKIILDPAADCPLDADDDAARVARYHALVQEGLDELDRGEGIEVTDVKAWLDTLGRQPV